MEKNKIELIKNLPSDIFLMSVSEAKLKEVSNAYSASVKEALLCKNIPARAELQVIDGMFDNSIQLEKTSLLGYVYGSTMSVVGMSMILELEGLYNFIGFLAVLHGISSLQSKYEEVDKYQLEMLEKIREVLLPVAIGENI